MAWTARASVVDVLTAHLPTDVDLIGYSREIDPPARSTVLVRLDTVAPGAARGLTTYTFALILIAAQQAAGPGDDELEQLLEDVLFALDQASPAGITWSTSTRSLYQTNPAFEVTIAVTVTKE